MNPALGLAIGRFCLTNLMMRKWQNRLLGANSQLNSVRTRGSPGMRFCSSTLDKESPWKTIAKRPVPFMQVEVTSRYQTITRRTTLRVPVDNAQALFLHHQLLQSSSRGLHRTGKKCLRSCRRTNGVSTELSSQLSATNFKERHSIVNKK